MLNGGSGDMFKEMKWKREQKEAKAAWEAENGGESSGGGSSMRGGKKDGGSSSQKPLWGAKRQDSTDKEQEKDKDKDKKSSSKKSSKEEEKERRKSRSRSRGKSSERRRSRSRERDDTDSDRGDRRRGRSRERWDDEKTSYEESESDVGGSVHEMTSYERDGRRTPLPKRLGQASRDDRDTGRGRGRSGGRDSSRSRSRSTSAERERGRGRSKSRSRKGSRSRSRSASEDDRGGRSGRSKDKVSFDKDRKRDDESERSGTDDDDETESDGEGPATSRSRRSPPRDNRRSPRSSSRTRTPERSRGRSKSRSGRRRSDSDLEGRGWSSPNRLRRGGDLARPVTLTFYDHALGLRLTSESIGGAVLIMVAEVERNGPAYLQQTGLREGMVLSAINGTPLDGRESSDVVMRRLGLARRPLNLTFSTDEEVDDVRFGHGAFVYEDSGRSGGGRDDRRSGGGRDDRRYSRDSTNDYCREQRVTRRADMPVIRDKKRRSAIALHDFAGDEHGDLSFKMGETVMLSRTNAQPEKSWWKGKIKGDKKRAGVFPRDFVKEIGADAISHGAGDRRDSNASDFSDNRGGSSPGRRRVEPRSASPLATALGCAGGRPRGSSRRPPPLPHNRTIPVQPDPEQAAPSPNGRSPTHAHPSKPHNGHQTPTLMPAEVGGVGSELSMLSMPSPIVMHSSHMQEMPLEQPPVAVSPAAPAERLIETVNDLAAANAIQPYELYDLTEDVRSTAFIVCSFSLACAHFFDAFPVCCHRNWRNFSLTLRRPGRRSVQKFTRSASSRRLPAREPPASHRRRRHSVHVALRRRWRWTGTQRSCSGRKS